MLDLLSSPSVPTTAMKVGRMIKIKWIFGDFKSWRCEILIQSVLRSAEASIFCVTLNVLFISLYCLTPLTIQRGEAVFRERK